MSSWQQFAAAEPDFAGRVEALLVAHKHHVMATLRLDGSPRVSGTELSFDDGQLLIGMMSGTRRAADLRRDPRVAIHSHTVDPPEEDHSAWVGDAKLSGTAIELPPGSRSPDADWFAIDLDEVAFTRVGQPADHLVIESWKSGSALKTQRR